jgi:cutinase
MLREQYHAAEHIRFIRVCHFRLSQSYHFDSNSDSSITMRYSTILFTLLSLASAFPVAQPSLDTTSLSELDARQLGSSTENEFVNGGCRDVIFIFARGSGERGNMGGTVGPATARALRSELGASTVAVQGVDYDARVGTNALPGGTSRASATLMRDLLTDAASQCPDSIIVTGGYSQGAAVNHRAIENLPADVQDKIAGVVLFGDTQNRQDNGQIPNFPREKVTIFCNRGDLVCSGQLVVTAAHLAYQGDTRPAAQFLAQQVRAAQA